MFLLISCYVDFWHSQCNKQNHKKINLLFLLIFQIRNETGTRIDLPNENSDSDVITITGKKENVEKARVMIEAIQKELVSN